MKHASWHFISNAIRILMGPADSEGSTGGGAITGAPATDEQRGLRNVSDAVAELERRDRERRAAKKTEKAAAEKGDKPAPKADKEADVEPGDDDVDEGDHDEAKPEKRKADKDTKEKRKPKGGDDSDDEDDADEEDDEGDDDNDPEDDDADEGDDVADEPGDKKKAGDDDAEDSLEIEHEGKKHRIPAALKDAFLRQADYTRKTQEVGLARQTVHAAWQQAQETAAQLQQAQAVLSQFAQAVIGAPPDLALAQRDPQAYLVQRGLYEQRMAQLHQLSEHGQTLTRQQQEMQQRQQAEFIQQQTQHLLAAMPELKDPAKHSAFRQQTLELGAKYGFTQGEIDAVADHRMLLVLRDLARAQAQAGTREQASKSVKQRLANVPPKVAKPQAGGDQKGARNEEARRQFMKSGRSMKDVERYLRSTGG